MTAAVADVGAVGEWAAIIPNDAAADPERELVSGIRAGAGEAYRTLLQQYGQRMRMVARRFLHSDEDSADAVQDALLSAYQSIDTFVGSSRLWTWLCRILINVCL